MDSWKFYDITHRDHVYCNPLSSAKFEEIVEAARLPSGARVLDVACGKAELLVRLAERYAISGVGVDISPFCVRDAKAKAAARVPRLDLTFLEMDGARYDGPRESFDLAMCVGAGWIWGGYRGTLRALQRFVRPGGLLLIGQPYWRRPPDPAYLETEQRSGDTIATHRGNISLALEEGLTLLFVIASSEDDWDRYKSLQWQAAERFAHGHPEDPDVPEILELVRAGREVYLRWGRDTMGWSLYLFRR